jgi:putative ABC transport system permease protein
MTFARGNFKTGMESLKGAKWRNFWTMLGVIIGVASVISVVSIGEGIKLQISGQIKHLSKDLITIRPGKIGGPTKPSGLGLLEGSTISGSLSSSDVMTIQSLSSVKTVVPLSAASGTAKGDLSFGDGLIIGTAPDFADLIAQPLEYGSFFSEDDMGQHAAVLGKNAADKLFNGGIPLGHTFTYHGSEFIVKGIFGEFQTAPVSNDANYNNAIFIPYDTAETLSNKTAPTYEIIAKAKDKAKNQQVAAQISAALNSKHGGQHDTSVLLQSDTLASSNMILELLTRLITGVAAISLLVGGIGIMNVMLVSVTERLHEIGIRKAIGATNRQILGQFLVESTVLSLSGGVIGVIVSYVIDGVLRLTTKLEPSIPWEIVVIATGVSLAVGIVFGTIPALKAARKDPIEALRSVA